MNKQDIKKLASEYVKYKLNWVEVNEYRWEAESCYWRDNGEPIMYRIEKVYDDDDSEYHINSSDKELIGDIPKEWIWEKTDEIKIILQNDNYENVIAILLEQLISK